MRTDRNLIPWPTHKRKARLRRRVPPTGSPLHTPKEDTK